MVISLLFFVIFFAIKNKKTMKILKEKIIKIILSTLVFVSVSTITIDSVISCSNNNTSNDQDAKKQDTITNNGLTVNEAVTQYLTNANINDTSKYDFNAGMSWNEIKNKQYLLIFLFY